MRKRTFTVLSLLLGVVMFCSAQKKDDISMFPKATDGQRKAIIQLKKLPDESNYKIELIAGKIAEVDKCNTFFLSGKLAENNLEGWGYTYYTFTTTGAIGGTLMACTDNSKIKKFVTARETVLIRYNSKLPIVIYLPDGYEVRYKIWKTNNNLIKSTVEQ